MTRPFKLGVVLLAIGIWALFGQEPPNPTATEHAAGTLGAATICIGAQWAPQISITRSARHELRERMARYQYRTAIWIMGPFEEDCRAPDSIEEAWLLETLYGPPQRWVLDIVPLEDLRAPPVDPGEMFYIARVCGITVGVVTSKTVSRLSVELHRDAIRVYELDA